MKKNIRFYSRLFLSCGFVVLVFLPMLALLLRLDPQISLRENRNLASFPKLSDKNWLHFPEQFDSFFNDHFGFRNLLIYWNNVLKVKVLKNTPLADQVVAGKEGWWFYTAEKTLEAYKPFNALKEEALLTIRKNVQARADWLSKQGIHYLILVVPNKHTVYCEFLPDFIRWVGNDSHLNQIAAEITSKTNVPFLDLRPLFAAAKKKELLY